MEHGTQCPQCKNEEILKVIYYGLPAKLCANEKCNCLIVGFSLAFLYWLPFNGVFMTYEGSYWPALWVWLAN